MKLQLNQIPRVFHPQFSDVSAKVGKEEKLIYYFKLYPWNFTGSAENIFSNAKEYSWHNYSNGRDVNHFFFFSVCFFSNWLVHNGVVEVSNQIIQYNQKYKILEWFQFLKSEGGNILTEHKYWNAPKLLSLLYGLKCDFRVLFAFSCGDPAWHLTKVVLINKQLIFTLTTVWSLANSFRCKAYSRLFCSYSANCMKP